MGEFEFVIKIVEKRKFLNSGYCAIEYAESQTTSPDPFALGAIATGTVVRLNPFEHKHLT